MQPHGQVLVRLADESVPGLLLKWSRDRAKALVTHEVDGRVQTSWVPAEQLVPLPD
ncbi:hypothetical protein [Nocardioides sp. SYSU DS0651]|uniref:hypothetical protein n=1 Tax=Nocardioides sp. SYSU DS0651 TaxID=3415955 RepID=UPI003F4C51EA